MNESLPPPFQRDSFWAMMVHLSALTGFLSFGFGFFLGPILVWLFKKEEVSGLDAHFQQAINFQISMLIYSLIVVLSVVVTMGGWAIVATRIFAVIAILDAVFPVIAGVQAYEGNLFRYPLGIPFVR